MQHHPEPDSRALDGSSHGKTDSKTNSQTDCTTDSRAGNTSDNPIAAGHTDPLYIERRSPRPPRNFPGGAARLPRLKRPSEDIPEFVAPIRRNADEQAPENDRGFEAYYSTDSLFGSSPAPEDLSTDAEGPYAVLGLTRAATWEQVSKAHRRLVAQLHPDRYVSEESTIREAAERRVRDVNEAYATIRRERAVRH